MYKKYLTNEQRTNLEKIIRAGDEQLLAMFTEFRKSARSNEDFLVNLVQLADRKSKGEAFVEVGLRVGVEMQELEQKIKDNRRGETVEKKRLETIDTFLQSKFLKKVTHMSLVTEVPL